MRGDKNPKTFTGSALEKALADNQFERPAMQLVGMVKASEKQDHISFAPAGCETWTDVPSSMIEEAEHLGHQSCKGHSHPIFRLSLQEPKDPTAKVLMGLLAGASQGSRQAPVFGAPVQGRIGGLPGGPGGIGSRAVARRKDEAMDYCMGLCSDLYGSYLGIESEQRNDCHKLCMCMVEDEKDAFVCWAELMAEKALWY